MNSEPFNTILTIVNLTIWLCILYNGKKTTTRFLSPYALFAFGVLAFYVVPGIYWNYREWTYSIPNYLDGMPQVHLIAICLGFPMLLCLLIGRTTPIPVLEYESLSRLKFASWGANIFLLLTALGFAWRISLFTLGFQGRFERSNPTLFGSEDLGFLVGNVGYYCRMFYYVPMLIGTRKQVRLAYIAWVFDGLLQIAALHRYAMLIFIFDSYIFLLLRGQVFSIRRSVLVVSSILFTLTIVGYSAILAPDFQKNDSNFLSPLEVISLLSASTSDYIDGRFNLHSIQSESSSFLLRTIDDTMFRLYDGRSAAAVVPSYPLIYPYLDGETIIPVIYALIPRFFWPSKPELRDTHVLTTDFMPGDSGVNPLGTLAELYINGGYVLVFFGGIFSTFLFALLLKKLNTTKILQQIAICVTYPFIGEILVSASKNVSQRLSEGLRMILVYYFVLVILKLAYKGIAGKQIVATEGGVS